MFLLHIIVVVVITYQIQKNSIDTPNIFDQLRYVEHNVRISSTTKNSGSFEVLAELEHSVHCTVCKAVD